MQEWRTRRRFVWGERHQKVLEAEIKALIVHSPELKNRFDILTSIPGIGTITATTLISELEELGQINAKQVSELAGVGPMNWDSASHKGHRSIIGGRRNFRNALCTPSAQVGQLVPDC